MAFKARLLFRSRFVYGDGSIREMVLWELPEKLKGCLHRFKYRLYYGRADGICLVRYDNERGKGNHRHIEGNEEPYIFRNVEKLVNDFLADVDKVRGGKQ